ncbi:MAG: hypothetical protein AB8F95_12170 [Bacteroidia bacterium]
MVFRIILFIVLVAYFAIRWRRKADKSWTDYGFGLKETEHILKLLQKQDYESAEKGLLSLETNKLSHALVHIPLSLKEDDLKHWLANSVHDDLPNLFLGAYHQHRAWMERSHGTGGELNDEQVKGFRKHQIIAFNYLHEVSDTFPKILGEAYVKLVAIHRGHSEFEEAMAYFEMAKELIPDNVMLYVEKAETIQPKWGGSVELTSRFMDELPDSKLIRQVIETKLIVEGHDWNTNYLGGSLAELHQQAKKTLYQIDKDVTLNPPTSVHRFMLYGYMILLAQMVENKRLVAKYDKLIGRNLPLHPFGVPAIKA